MHPPLRGLRTVRLACVAITLAAFCAGAQAARPAPELGSLRGRFPAESIDSVERADAALAATAGAKGQVEQEFRSDAQACTKSFLVNDCLDRARLLQRKRLDEIASVELEANRFKRKDRADRLEADRARRDTERAANQKSDDAQRTRNREAFESKQAQAKRDEAAKARSTEIHKPTVKRTPAPPADPDDAQRAKNATAYASKVNEAKLHKAEIARRVATNTADRKRRADDKAAKAAKAAAVPPLVP